MITKVNADEMGNINTVKLEDYVDETLGIKEKELYR